MSYDGPEPDMTEVEQLTEMGVPEVPIRFAGPQSVRVLPAKRASTTSIQFSGAGISSGAILEADPRVRRAWLVSASPFWYGSQQDLVQPNAIAGTPFFETAFLVPANTPVVLEGFKEEIYIVATAAQVVSCRREFWAD